MMIIVDGYNVIYKWKFLSKYVYNMELARARLVNILANYQGYTEEEVIIVFDSSIRNSAEHSLFAPQNINPVRSKPPRGGCRRPDVKSGERTSNGVKVIYAPSNQGADIFIEKMVLSHKNPEDITVVTGDVLERTAVTRSGANSMSPERFEEEVIKICKRR